MFLFLHFFQKYPQYYEVIRSPIDLKMIALRIRESKYESLDDLERDLSLMIRNAQTYNDPKSVIFKVNSLCYMLCNLIACYNVQLSIWLHTPKHLLLISFLEMFACDLFDIYYQDNMLEYYFLLLTKTNT